MMNDLHFKFQTMPISTISSFVICLFLFSFSNFEFQYFEVRKLEGKHIVRVLIVDRKTCLTFQWIYLSGTDLKVK